VGKLVLIIVTYLVAIRTVDKNIQVKVVPAESIGPTECEVGQGRADVGTVLCVNDTITVQVLILDITYPYGGILGIYTINGRMKGLGGILNVFL
jgi:hypothetical protein